jgi:urate oxidase
MEKTSGLEDIKRKAILDGILFEVFFDSDGKIRDKPKDYHFDRIFSLQKYTELSSSFEFIASCLASNAERYYSIPGKAHQVSIDVTLADDAENIVKGIYLAGKNILSTDDPDYDQTDILYRTRPRDTFESDLAKEMLVPRHLLTITYSKPAKRVQEVKYPYGYSVRKLIV